MVSSPKPAPVGVVRVLLIDDDPAQRRALQRLLAPECQVTAVDGVRAALAYLAQGMSFDAVVIDLMMPLINGRQGLDILRKVAPTLGERAVVLTSGSSDHVLSAWLAELPSGSAFSKPPDREVLLAGIRARIAAVPEQANATPAHSTMRPKKR